MRIYRRRAPDAGPPSACAAPASRPDKFAPGTILPGASGNKFAPGTILPDGVPLAQATPRQMWTRYHCPACLHASTYLRDM